MSILEGLSVPQSERRQAIINAYYMDEAICVNRLLDFLGFDSRIETDIAGLAERLVVSVREHESKKSGIEAFMVHYDLSTEEGIVLMCLAEALLRIPDKETENLLIRDKLSSANWDRHLGLSQSSFVNMATWGLALTGKVLKTDHKAGYFQKVWKGLVRKSGEPVVRRAVRDAIKVLSKQFVLGRNIKEALVNSQENIQKGYNYSYDMLGEAARTQQDADRYFNSYADAIEAIGQSDSENTDLYSRPAISVKLSALYPRYEFSHQEKATAFLSERLRQLMRMAMKYSICLTVDAEEADRLDISLDIIERVYTDKEFKNYNGLGMAIQAYQRRSYSVIEWVADLSKQHNKRMRIRLVKGAYWDTEVKIAQENGVESYPVFTRKSSTDVSYLACAKLMLENQDAIYPQFATHNAYTVAAILSMFKGIDKKSHFEFQHLQGMGHALHNEILHYDSSYKIPCRIYAPVGSHEDLLPYLVRRLLENGANSSFVNQLADKEYPISHLIASPIVRTDKLDVIPNNKIPAPQNIYGKVRLNSKGFEISDYNQLKALDASYEKLVKKQYTVTPLLKSLNKNKAIDVKNPADSRDIVGKAQWADESDVNQALQNAVAAEDEWNCYGPSKRADILLKTADLFEENYHELMCLAQREAGKVLPDVIAEVREAIDFCRYYSVMAKKHLKIRKLKGYTGEANTLSMQGRGTFLCISPWNFPVAIFTGQIAAALVAGNCVIAKPAETTSLVADFVVRLFHDAGVPKSVLQLLPGEGRVIGNALVKDERIAGVLFTGSTATAKSIQRGLADREGAIVPLVAETGGMNAMIVDSTALPEQVVDDVIQSAFGSAGQRCSALRVLFVQDDVADKIIDMLKGAMAEINVGLVFNLQTDVGPVIDATAQKVLQEHIDKMQREATLIHAVSLPQETAHGYFIAPHAFELSSLDQLTKEVFGPVLHVIRYSNKDLDKVIDKINALNFGLTFGMQTRINDKVEYVASRIKAGNIYINRNIIGAVVGVQPFGGSRLSGTGPKAGGPHYVQRLCSEKTVTINTTAAGGNASLMSLSDE